ncbi:hypothetical protein LCGC14_1667870 [marine sediment metagenome]|uniref:Uncharacterized protein n=1 Tax=marine sediment metagenome TaxID=412755 RepID=A0A0F9KS77_9ZZZZ
MKLNEIKRIVRQEIVARSKMKQQLHEGMSRKDFIMMAQEIRKASPKHRAVLTAFAIVLGKNQNPQFDVERFKDAVNKPGKL